MGGENLIIYEANETDFFSNGLGTLPDATSALVTEERNGEFVLDVIYPQQGLRSELLTKNRIIKADAGHELKDQRFVIKKVTPTMDNDGYIYLTVHAEHVSYITADLGVTPNLTLSGNATQALEQWQANLVGGHPDIAVDSDIVSTHETNLDITKATNARQVLGGVEGSILDTWGGEYKFDNLHISLRGQRGTTANTLISYGRNLLTFEQEDDITDTYTSIYPYANVGLADGNNSKLITVDGYFVDSQYVDRYPNRKLLPVDFGSEFTDYKIGSKPSESDTGIYTTEAEIKKKLIELAKQYIENNRIGIPKVSTKITFADLSKTSEYAPLEQVNLCDIIPIRFEKLGIDTTIKVTRVVWNVLLDEYDSIELGDLRTTLGESISALESKTAGLANAVTTAQSTADNQNSIFRTNGGTAEPVAKKTGDLWFKTDGDYQYMYQWDGAVWHEVVNTKTTDDIAKEVDQAHVKMEELVKKANDDTTIFRTEGQEAAPTAKKKGDLWFKTDGDYQYMYQWDGSVWHEIVSTKMTEDITKQVEQAQADAKALSNEVESAKKQAQEAFAKAGFNADEISNVKTATSEVTETLTSTARQASELSESLKNVASETASRYSKVSSELSGARDSLTAKASELAKEVASNSANVTKANSQLYSQSEGLAKVSQSATKMEQTMTGLSGRVHTVETTASETKEALADAKGNITTLTKRADGTDTKIADAQGRVQTLESRAGKWDLELSKKVDNTTYNAGIQNLGNQINLKANKSDLDGYATKAQLSVESDRITQQAGEIVTVKNLANSANDKIDGLRIGGRNLLKNSRGRFQPNGSKLDNYAVYKDTTAYLENGKTYTISAKAKDGLVFSSVHDPTKQSNKVTLWMVDAVWRYNVIVSDDKTNTVGTVFKWGYPTDTYRLRVNTYNADNLGYVELVQIQEGTRATEWQPSNLDLPDTIVSTVTTTTNAKQIVDSSGIYSEVTKLVDTKVGGVTTQLNSYKRTVDDTGNKLRDVMGALKLDSNGNLTSNFNELIKTASGVEERYTQLNGKIDGLGGGVNLAVKTSKRLQNVNITGTWLFIGGNGNPYFNDLSSYQGRHITVRVWIERPTADAWVQIYTNKGTIGGNHIKAGQSGYSTASGVIPTGFTSWNIPIGGGAQTMSFGWKEFKIELGEIATPWTPAFEDISTEIAKTNETIKTVDGTVATVKNNLDKTKSIVTQLSNLFDVNVGDSSISVTNGGVLVKGKQIHIDGQTSIDNGVIDSAKIKSLDAGKITTGTLNAAKLNVINLNANSINAGTLSGAHLHITKDSYIDNASIDGAKIKSLDAGKITTGTLNAASVKVINLDANNIKTGTLSGNNLSLNLDDGTVSFKKGKIVSSNNKLILNIDDGSLAVGDASQRQGMMFNQGKMYMYDQGYFGNSTWNGNVYDWMLEMKKHPYAVLEYSSSFSGTSGSLFGGSGANFHSTSGVAIAYDKNVSQTASAGTTSGIFDDWNPLDGHGVFINENGIAMGAEDKLVSIVGGTSFDYNQQSIWYFKPTILVGTNLWTDNVYDHGYNVNKMISDGPNIYMQASALITDTSAAIFNVENGDVEFAIKGNDRNVIINASGHTNNGLIVKGSQNITNWLGCQDLSVRGNKNSVIQTTAGWTKINAYETAEYYFGDLGTAVTDDTSTVRIGIEPLFNETVNTNIPYQVFVTSYGEGYAWVAERGSNYFVIKSSVPNLEIGYEIKAKRKGYENVRLEIDEHMEVNKQ